MGNTDGKPSRAVLQSAVPLSFKAMIVKKEVAEIAQSWFEEGAPLALTRDTFKSSLCLDPYIDVDALFCLFDTDNNQKVDALEILAAMVLLANGTVEEKIEVIFPIFDFAGNDRLNFDELNILLHSVCRGLAKMSSMPLVGDQDVTETCRQVFDSHNLKYCQDVKKEQVKRFVKGDVECVQFMDAFHRACSLPAIEAVLARQEQAQATAFKHLCGSTASAVPVDDVLQNLAFRQSFDNPPEQTLWELVGVMVQPGSNSVELERFAEAARAWNVFNAVDCIQQGKVDPNELSLLLWLWLRQEPSLDKVKEQRKVLGFLENEWITKSRWLAACVNKAQ